MQWLDLIIRTFSNLNDPMILHPIYELFQHCHQYNTLNSVYSLENFKLCWTAHLITLLITMEFMNSFKNHLKRKKKNSKSGINWSRKESALGCQTTPKQTNKQTNTTKKINDPIFTNRIRNHNIKKIRSGYQCRLRHFLKNVLVSTVKPPRFLLEANYVKYMQLSYF